MLWRPAEGYQAVEVPLALAHLSRVTHHPQRSRIPCHNIHLIRSHRLTSRWLTWGVAPQSEQCTKRLRFICQNTEVDIIHWVRTMFTAFPARYLSRAREPGLLTWMLIDKDLFDYGKLLEEGTHSNSCYEKTKKCPKSWILSEKSFTLPRDSGFYSILNTWVLMWGFSWLEPPIPIIPSQVRFPSTEKSSMNLIV